MKRTILQYLLLLILLVAIGVELRSWWHAQAIPPWQWQSWLWASGGVALVWTGGLCAAVVVVERWTR